MALSGIELMLKKKSLVIVSLGGVKIVKIWKPACHLAQMYFIHSIELKKKSVPKESKMVPKNPILPPSVKKKSKIYEKQQTPMDLIIYMLCVGGKETNKT